MTQTNTPSPVTFLTDVERARHLIPGFLKNSLGADDKEWMTQFLNTLGEHGGDVHIQFKQEMAWVERSQQQLAQDAPSFDEQAGWQRLQGRLDTPTHAPLGASHRPANASALGQATSKLKALIRGRIDNVLAWWKKPLIGVLASAMIVAQMGLLAAAVKQIAHMQTASESVVPSSGAPSLEGMAVVTLVFKDSASLLEARTLIDSIEGRVVDGPGALGVWQVAVPKAKLDATLKRLGAAASVESAAPQ